MIRKNFKVSLLAILILLTKPASSQLTYGIQLQVFGGSTGGVINADSILVVADSKGASIKFKVPENIGLFVEYKPKWQFPLIFRTEINYRPHPIGLDLAIYNGKFFGGKPDGVYTYKEYNFGFDIPISSCYNLIQKGNIQFLKARTLEVGILAGVTFQFLARGEREIYPIGKNFSPGISDVNFAIYNTMRTTNYFYNYGVRVRLGHFIATYRRDLLLTNSSTNDLNVWGNTYSFKTSYNYESISLGYTFSLKKKKKD